MKVSDPSQPYKIALMIVSLGLGVWWGFEVLNLLKEILWNIKTLV